MLRRNIFLLLLVPLLLLTGCAVTDFDKSVDFSKYRTYSWAPSKVNVSNPVFESSLIDKKIKAAVRDQFGAKNIIEVKSNPDFLVKYQIHTEERERRRNSYMYPAFYPFAPFGVYPYPFGYWNFAMRYGYGMMGYSNETEKYTEGTLILDVLDASTKELVWRGSVSSNVDVQRLQKQIDKGVKAILKKYPGKPFGDQPDVLPKRDEVS